MLAAAVTAVLLLAGCTANRATVPSDPPNDLTPGGTAYPPSSASTPTGTSGSRVSSTATTVTLGPPTSGTPSTGTSGTSGTATTSGGPPTGSTAPTTGTVPSTRSSGPVPTGPWPDDLTADQVKDAQAALKAYQDYWELVDASGAKPDRDWTADVNALVSAQAAKDVLDGVEYFRLHKLHTTGRSVVQATVSDVARTEIRIDACVDQSGSDIVNTLGHSVRAENKQGTLWRFRTSAVVNKFVGNTWQVTRTDDDRASSC